MIDAITWLCIGLGGALAVVHREMLGRLWRSTEDPRTVAAVRIVTGSLLIASVVAMAPVWDYALSSEGLFTGAQARARFSGGQRLSLLYFVDSPGFVRVYAGALITSLALLTVGAGTAVTRWTSLLLFHGWVARNAIHLGGEQMFGPMLFYLCLARCGEAWSADAWLRRRRTGEGPRAIPAWPRYLMVLQFVPILVVNGLAKDGVMWAHGDTLYFLFNHPHFAPAIPSALQWKIAAALGTNVFRLMTWVTHAWEILFVFAVVGFFRRRVEVEDGRASRVLRVLLGLGMIALSWQVWEGPDRARMPFVLGHVLALVVVASGLGICPRGRWVDVVLGRRLWLTLLVLFSGSLFFVLRIGWFTGMVLFGAVVFFDGEELGRSKLALSEPPTPPRWHRRLAAGISALTVLAITAVVTPHDRDAPASWRRTLEAPLRVWVDWTTGFQTWRMFAPQAPTHQFDLEVRIVHPDETVQPVGAGIVDLERVDSDWGHEKRHKIRRRLSIPAGRRYLEFHAAFVCRRFAKPGDVVELVRVRVPTPPPAATAADLERALAEQERSTVRRVIRRQDCL